MSSPAHSRREELVAAVVAAFRVSTTRSMALQTAVAARTDLNLTDLNCLNLLMVDGALTAGELATRTGLTRGGAITAAIDRLEAAGLVRRAADPRDRRRILVEPVVNAIEERIAPYFEVFIEPWSRLLDEYDAGELQLLLEFTARGNEIAERVTSGLYESGDPRKV